MKTLTQKEIETIIKNHKHWLKRDCVGWENMKANFSDTTLEGINFARVNLEGANFVRANLRSANFEGANLVGAYLSDAINVPFIPMACPETGSFIGYKKAQTESGYVIVELKILEDARRSSALGRECRCDKAERQRCLALEAMVAKNLMSHIVFITINSFTKLER